MPKPYTINFAIINHRNYLTTSKSFEFFQKTICTLRISTGIASIGQRSILIIFHMKVKQDTLSHLEKNDFKVLADFNIMTLLGIFEFHSVN